MNESLVWLLSAAAAGLTIGHIAFGRRWMLDSTRDIAAVYVRLWRKVRSR